MLVELIKLVKVNVTVEVNYLRTFSEFLSSVCARLHLIVMHMLPELEHSRYMTSVQNFRYRLF